jgi:hypothetical protein
LEDDDMSDELIARLVKPLKFEDGCAFPPTGGYYRVLWHDHRGRWNAGGHGMSDALAAAFYDSKEVAISACNAHHTARILAALDTDALARLTAENEALKVKADALVAENNTLRRALFGQGGQNPVRVDGTPYYPKGPGND